MNKAVKLDAAGIKVILDGISRPIKNAYNFFSALGIMQDNDLQTTFRLEGARGGQARWAELRSPIGSPRYGTDRSRSRRYTGNDRILQASGLFRKSFRIRKVTKNELVYGTNHRLAGKIGSRPERQALFVTDEDLKRYKNKYVRFYDAGIIF